MFYRYVIWEQHLFKREKEIKDISVGIYYFIFFLFFIIMFLLFFCFLTIFSYYIVLFLFPTDKNKIPISLSRKNRTLYFFLH